MPLTPKTGKLIVYLATNEWHGLPELSPKYSKLYMLAEIIKSSPTDQAYVLLALAHLKGVGELEPKRLYMYTIKMQNASAERYMQRVGRLLKQLKLSHPSCETLFLNESDHKYYKRGIYACSEKGMKRVRL